MGYYKLEKLKKLLEKENAFIINERRTHKGYGEKVKARIYEWNGGRNGTPGEYIAIVCPRLGKNGKELKTAPKVLEIIDTIKKGYNYGGLCAKTITIKEYLQ